MKFSYDFLTGRTQPVFLDLPIDLPRLGKIRSLLFPLALQSQG
jgi:hypothetical protein